MKHKPQISFGPDTYGAMCWTIKFIGKDRKRLTYQSARVHWDEASADWSIPAWQEMARMVMEENVDSTTLTQS